MTQLSRSGGQILVDALKIHGVDTAFCVPGESYLPVLDALYDAKEKIRLITCRHESGAANMAEAYGKLTGKPGICFVTRGPGATNASIGVHTAKQDSTPMIMFVGQVARGMMGREAFQEINYEQMFAPVAKWVTQLEDPQRIPEIISRAFHIALSGRRGPVVIALPEDILDEAAIVSDTAPYHIAQASPTAQDLETMTQLLSSAQRPLMIIGGSGWSEKTCKDILTFSEKNNLPVICSFRRQDLFSNYHKNYIGDAGIGINPKLAARIKDADLLLVVGARLGEMPTSSYTLIDIPRPKQKFIHIYPGAEELGRVYQTDLPINASIAQFCATAAALQPVANNWERWLSEARADYLDNMNPTPYSGKLDMGQIMMQIKQALPGDSIITNGAGNYSGWLHRFYQFSKYPTQLAPTSGAMGYGVPAAIAAKLVHPNRQVVCFAGDGCFLMSAAELATATMYKLPVIFLVINNNMYGTIRMHQEKHYPGRISGTDLINPDFAALAQSFGAENAIIEETAQFLPAFEKAMKSDKPTVLELRVDPEIISTRTTITALRNQTQKKH
jgi:acetolactate synthase-1/2/3 large subunit